MTGKVDVESGSVRPRKKCQYWEAAACSTSTVDDTQLQQIRQQCKFSGAVSRRGRAPLLLAKVEGTNDCGRAFCWVARRARKRLAQPHECACPPAPVDWLSCFNPVLHYYKPGWWVGATFFLGSLLFLITGIAREFDAISLPEPWPPGIGSLSAGLGPWPEVVAVLFLFTPGVLIAIGESTNMDWNERIAAWEKRGRQGHRPLPRVLPSAQDLRCSSWWAAFVQLPGILVFDIACVSDLVGFAKDLPIMLWKWLVGFNFILGGCLFAVASILAGLEYTGSWWRAAVPTSMKLWYKLSWQAVFLGFWGGMLFVVNGVGMYCWVFDWAAWKWLVGFGHIFGSVLFMGSAYAALLEQANPSHE